MREPPIKPLLSLGTDAVGMAGLVGNIPAQIRGERHEPRPLEHVDNGRARHLTARQSSRVVRLESSSVSRLEAAEWHRDLLDRLTLGPAD